MNEKTVSTVDKRSPGKLILPSLVFSRFAIAVPEILTGLLLIDIGLTFGYSVGAAGQIRTICSIVAVFFSLLMGILSVRFKHKLLLMTGLLLVSISALACSFASNFSVMLLSYSISGLGSAMVAPMAFALVGEHFALEMRPNAIGWIMTGAAVSYLVGSPAIGFIADFGGWRLAFLGYVLPVSLLTLMLAAKGLPTTVRGPQVAMSRGSYFEGFKGVFSNRSADACLIGSALVMATYQAVLVYSASFYRQRFLVSTGLASIFVLGGALFFTLGAMVSGRFVKRIGRKPLTVLTSFLGGIFIVSYTSLPNLWLSLAARFLGGLFIGMTSTASNSLTLEQTPKFRGTMMSVNSAAGNMGSTLGAGVGGLALLLFNYEGMAISLGVMGLVGAVIFHLLAIDPTRTGMSARS
jgi:predicted MFS family arabinose efflux permease